VHHLPINELGRRCSDALLIFNPAANGFPALLSRCSRLIFRRVAINQFGKTTLRAVLRFFLIKKGKIVFFKSFKECLQEIGSSVSSPENPG